MTKPNPDNRISQSQIEAWYRQCVANLNRVTPEGEEKNHFNLIYEKRAHNKRTLGAFKSFSFLLLSASLGLSKKLSDKIFDSISMSELASVNTAFMWQRQGEATMLIGHKLIENKSAFNIIKNIDSPMERFKFIFFHEAAHVILTNQKIANNPQDIENVFSAQRVCLDSETTLSKIIEQGSQKPYAREFLNQCALLPGGSNTEKVDNFSKFHEVLKSLREEMFCDCFSVVMCHKDDTFTTNIEALIDNIALNRKMFSLGSTVLYTHKSRAKRDLSKKGNDLIPDQDHETSLAMQRLSGVMREKFVDIKKYNLLEIIALCQEMADYGVSRFMYEASCIEPDYHRYLKGIEIVNPQKDLFDSGLEAPNTLLDDKTNGSKDARVNRVLPIEEVFHSLTPEDRKISENKVGDVLRVANILETSKMDENLSLEEREKIKELQSTTYTKENLENLDSKYLAITLANYHVIHNYYPNPNQMLDSPQESLLSTSPQLKLFEKVKINREEDKCVEPETAVNERDGTKLSTLREKALDIVNHVVFIPSKKYTP